MKIIQRPAGAALTIVLGVAASTAEIIDEDGTAYRFTGSPTDAQHWLDRKRDELKVAHSVDVHGGWEPDEHPPRPSTR
jgi:hypothetical protein